jgi:DNA-binding transcriptional regulator YdaS (Cro superfamily)
MAAPLSFERRQTMPSATPPEKIADEGLRLAVAQAGSLYALAKLLGMSVQAISEWQRIPSHRILQVEAVTGIPREKLRPELYREQLAFQFDHCNSDYADGRLPKIR